SRRGIGPCFQAGSASAVLLLRNVPAALGLQYLDHGVTVERFRHRRTPRLDRPPARASPSPARICRRTRRDTDAAVASMPFGVRWRAVGYGPCSRRNRSSSWRNERSGTPASFVLLRCLCEELVQFIKRLDM